MSISSDLYGQPSNAFLEARPLMQAITQYANVAYRSSHLPAKTRQAFLGLPVRNALSMIERASLNRMAADEETTLLHRLEAALAELHPDESQEEYCLLRVSLCNLHQYLDRTVPFFD